jgi:fibro-slime domain-containing protein
MLYAGTSVPGPGHPDFQSFTCGVTQGLVQSTLGLDGKPVFGPNGSSCLTNATNFCWWYHDADCAGPGSQNGFAKNVTGALTLTETSPNVFQYNSSQFYPIDGMGWNAGPNPQTSNDCSGSTGHNFAFTTEIHRQFVYQASSSPTLSVGGSDDIWVFINGHLAIDLGGVHASANGSVTLNAAAAANFGLTDGGTYPIDIFQAERHTCNSEFSLTLAGFTSVTTAASVSIEGRVLDRVGYGIRGARVTLTDSSGTSTPALTNAFGYYRFSSVRSGESYVATASARGLVFAPRLITANDSVSGFDFRPQ